MSDLQKHVPLCCIKSPHLGPSPPPIWCARFLLASRHSGWKLESHVILHNVHLGSGHIPLLESAQIAPYLGSVLAKLLSTTFLLSHSPYFSQQDIKRTEHSGDFFRPPLQVERSIGIDQETTA